MPPHEHTVDEAGQQTSRAVRASLLFGLPSVLVLAWLMWPTIAGGETLILRDVLEVHMSMKASQAAAFHAGYFPVVDPARTGGQPLSGNPNVVPFYPDNLLFLVAPLFWALNAHFWIHLLLAPLTAYWMGRAWGLPKPAAWAVGVCFATSGFMLSQLNLYNLVAGAALTPALVGAVLHAGERRPWAAPLAGLAWALLLLSGDPLTAVLAVFVAATAFVVRYGPRPRLGPVALLGTALALGTLVALPQIVEFARILPLSLRGHQGFGEWRLSVGALRPIHAIEWLVPLAFGRYDLIGEGGMWGAELFEGKLPIFLSLYPGLLALVLVAASGRPRSRAAWWGWAMVGVGIFCALGGYNPAAAWLFELPGGGAFRYPIKVWPLVAVGASLLCGIGFDRTFGAAIAGRGRARLRPAGIALGVLAVALLGVWLVLVLAPGRFEAVVLSHAPASWPDRFAAVERARWIATIVASVAILAGLGGALALGRTRPVLGASLLLALHSVGQVFFLHPLAVTDQVSFYREPPPALAAVARDAPVAHAEYLDLFGKSPSAIGPDNRPQWAIRQHHLALFPFAGVLHGLRYELDRSPEGLGSFLERVAVALVEGAPDDSTRVRTLSRWGVATVISEDLLRGVPPALAERVASFRGIMKPVHVYRLRHVLPEVSFAETVVSVPDLTAARDVFLDPAFDAECQVILPGAEDLPVPGAADPTCAERRRDGLARVVRSSPESLEIAVDAQAAGVVVVQRADLSLWRAEVDGVPARVEPANVYRIGVRVPEGARRVRLWIDRRPLVVSSWIALAGLLGLVALLATAVAVRRPRRGVAPGPEGAGEDPVR